jgi:hypothetical protein
MHRKGSVLVLALIIIACVIIAGVYWYWFHEMGKWDVNSTSLNVASKSFSISQTPIETQTTFISLDQQFTLRKGEDIKVASATNYDDYPDDYYLTISPKNIARGGDIYQFTDSIGTPITNSLVPYTVNVFSTDNQTYATLVVESSVNICSKKSGVSADDCWNALTQRLDSIQGIYNYCSNIASSTIENSCWQNLIAEIVTPQFSTSTWITYHDPIYGLSFQYPDGLFVLSTSTDGSVEAVVNFYYQGNDLPGVDIEYTSSTQVFDVAAGLYQLKYDPMANRWLRLNWDASSSAFTVSCEQKILVGPQHIPVYDVSDQNYTQYIAITKQGLLSITEVARYLPVDTDLSFDAILNTLTFDNPASIIQANCNP